MFFSRLREWVAIGRDMCASVVDGGLCVLCCWAVLMLYGKGRESLAYAGMPPRTLEAARAFAYDPFLGERLLAWGTVLGCAVLAFVLAASAVEGAWAVLRRI